MLKASFYGLEKVENPIELINVISADNPKQTDEAFLAFVTLVNSCRGKIQNLVIIDSSFLHRHYDKSYLLASKKSSWLEFNMKHIKKLQVPYQIVHWSTIINSSQYKEIYKKIRTDYEGDVHGTKPNKDFRAIVIQTAQKFTHKGGIKSIIDYLLEECAAALTLGGHLTYPGELNPALRFSLEINKSALNFILYKITGKRSLPSNLEIKTNLFETEFEKEKVLSFKPSFFALSVAAATDTILGNTALTNKDKVSFLTGYLEYCQKFIKK
jgi:hypothetical protein